MKNKLKKALKKYGSIGTIKRLPYFIHSRIKRFIMYPSVFTRYGTTHYRWQKTQTEHELDYWNNRHKKVLNDGVSTLRQNYFPVTNNRFEDLKLDFADGTVIDIGCGPDGGLLPFIKAKFKIGIDALANEYAINYPVNKDILMIPSMAENIPLLSGSIDACYCVNVLDHVMRPYKVLSEIYRVIKKGGYFAFAVDVGGTKAHPVKIYQKDLDSFFEKHLFKVTEKKCSTKGSTWGEDSGIPLYVFQGYKL